MNRIKKYLVIGSPINHSLSPKLQNYWMKMNNISGIYEKKEINKDGLKEIVELIKKKEINGVNVTVPFKNKIIPFLDKLSHEAETTQSVNTLYIKDGDVVGHNTDIEGFEFAIKFKKIDVSNKNVLILGAGGVVPSLIEALNKMKTPNIMVSNRTKTKAENLKRLFKNINIVDWGDIPNFDLVINATSVGLKKDEKINLDLSNVGKNKFFYDIIYNPSETSFLKMAKKSGNDTENGKMMFIYQALASFKIWHGISPEINNSVVRLLDQ